MFVVLQKKYLVIVLIFIIIVGIIFSLPIRYTSAHKLDYTIVLDAGYGGRDGGVIGYNNTIEKDINLKYTLALKKLLESNNIRVILTRSDDDGLYDNNSKNKKLSDMSVRQEIIENTQPELVVSIHMNSFPLKSVSGANCFYGKDNESGKQIADYIQKLFAKNMNSRNSLSKEGDYYILNCTQYPSVLIECGFLSNPTEEAMLNSDEYQNIVIYNIYCGIVAFLGTTKNATNI